MARTHIDFQRQGDVGRLVFACQQSWKPATLDLDVLQELQTRLAEVEALGNSLRALVVTSASAKYFIVGANINTLEMLDAETIAPWVHQGHEVFNRLEALPLPTIARVEGFALGGGLELAMACDLIIASPDARFGQPEARLGLVAGWGGSHRLPHRVGLARAKGLFFTGTIIDAEEACRCGLVDFVGSSVALDGFVSEFLDGVRACSPSAVAEMKALLNQCATSRLEQICLQEEAASVRCISDSDTRRRVAAFLEGRRKRGK
jgi:enoyl-CoA hydratase